MAIKIIWDDDEQTIVRWKFENNWDETDFVTAQDAVFELTKNKDSIDTIIIIPADIPIIDTWLSIILNAQKKTIELRKDQMGITVFVCGSKFWHTLLCMVQRTNYVSYWYFSDTVEGARALIAARQRTTK